MTKGAQEAWSPEMRVAIFMAQGCPHSPCAASIEASLSETAGSPPVTLCRSCLAELVRESEQDGWNAALGEAVAQLPVAGMGDVRDILRRLQRPVPLFNGEPL